VLAIRLAKIGCVATLALYAGLVAFGNLTDYCTNFTFVSQVLDMDDVPAMTSPLLHHAGYS
jgi:predicted small integral membrane protein